MDISERIYDAIGTVKDQKTFVQRLLKDTLGWPILDGIDDLGDICFEWSADELKADGLEKKLTDGRVYQIQKLHDDQPWGIFLLEFKHDDVFFKNRGLTGPLRKVLRGLVHNRRKSATLPSWDRDDLLFICTDKHYRHYRFAHFAAPKDKEKSAPLSLFGWNDADTALHTLCDYNLPSLVWSDNIHQPQWKDAFSIEKVTKTFFRQVATLFTDLVGGTRKDGSKTHQGKNLLKMPGKQDDTVRKEFAVRLIGRLIFCWFLKKKVSKAGIPLVPDEILSTAAITNNTGVGGYYHSVLEPLFFELLNTPADSRKKDYRKQPWSYIPFLNGGLFTPHEFDFYEPADTGYSKHLNTLLVPDEWLNDLLSVFERYNFTIDENTPIDVELSIEPEMLGRIFENLLAEINPETGETARKATGSYYTPRPIVEYMVDESLKQYLVTKTGIAEDKIASLLSYAEQDGSDFTEKQTEALIDALHTVKIIDPACGSGAFPMGILQKILLILQKLDPDSKRWLDKLLDSIPDPMYRRELKRKIKVPNYLHKLGIIRDCIFGVDIQPIAVEISKLRCFLSLIVDENVDDTDDNRGVEHLPNLEFKFVCANTLIGLPERHQQGQKTMFEADDKIDQLKELRDRYLISYGKEKKQIEQEFRAVQSAMFKHSLDWGGKNSQTTKLSQWNPFSDEPSTWFDPEWMFGIKEGFDIAIGNPPYVVTKDKLLREIYKESISGRANLYGYFIHRSLLLIGDKGVLCFINPRTLLTDAYFTALRKYILNHSSILNVLNITDRRDVFENVLQSVIVNIFGKTDPRIKIKNIERKADIYSPDHIVLDDKSYIYDKNENPIFIIARDKTTYRIFDKIRRIPSVSEAGFRFVTGKIQWDLYSDYLSSNPQKNSTRLVWAENIQRYYFKEARLRADRLYINTPLKDSISHIQEPTIVVQRTTAVEQEWRIIATIVSPQLFNYPLQSENHTSYIEQSNAAYSLEFVLANLNSRFFDFVFRHINSNTQVSAGELNSLPLIPISRKQQEPFIALVDKITAAKKIDTDADTTDFERQIDQMVYKLYGLTKDEIAIFENPVK